MKLDIGCGSSEREGFTGMDKRPLPGVEIVHDLEVFPYPLDAGSCVEITASHILEHIKPWHTISVMDELWRILETDGKLSIWLPYAGTPSFWQDPTHCNGFNETTFEYFDPEHLLYTVYKPKPWRIEPDSLITGLDDMLTVVLRKIEEQ